MGQPFASIQTIFSRGELSPRIIGRVDNKAYFNAYYYGQNMIPYPQGSITKRPGTRYVSTVKDSADQTTLVPFRFSTVQNYMLEFGDLYFRVYRNRGQVQTSPGVAYEVVTPWPASVLRELSFVQSADTLYVFHRDYQPRVITRTSDTSWTLGTFNFVDGPYLNTNVTATTITPGATTGATTLTASASLWSASDVGRQVRLFSNSIWGYATITGYTSPTVVNATVVEAFGSTSSTSVWRLSYFGGVNEGWPSKGTIYEERMILANSLFYPSTLWASVTGDFTNFEPTNAAGTVSDDNAFTVTIGDDQVNNINWLSSGRVLLIGTSAADHSMSGGNASSYSPMTPTNVTIKREAISGSKEYLKSIRMGSSVFYVSESSLKLKELYYDFGIDNYISRDATIFNSHITESGIVDIDYQAEPDPTAWCARVDGQLIGFSYDKTNEVEGWHRHILGGANAAVKAVGCIPRPDLSGNDLWLIVSRTIGGSTVQYIEYMEEYFDENNGQETAFYVDSGLSYDGVPVTSVSGLSHLEGEEVAVFADGAVQPNKVVTGGAITLTSQASVVHVGLPYQNYLTLLPVEAPQFGTIQGRVTGISKIHVYVTSTMLLKYGYFGINGRLDSVPSLTMGVSTFGGPPPLSNGLLPELDPPSGYSRDNMLTLAQNSPTPLTINYVVQEISING
jgi:hypothetical protein